MTWLEIIEPLRKSSPATWRTIQRARLVEIGPGILRLHYGKQNASGTAVVELPEVVKVRLQKLMGLTEIQITTEDER